MKGLRLRYVSPVILMFLVALPLSAQTWAIYDQFRGPLINPDLWFGGGTTNRDVLDYERQIQNGSLMLRIRSYGNHYIQDNQPNWAQNGLEVADPTGIIGIAAMLTVTRAIGNSCDSSGWLLGQMGLRATFFNSGEGNQIDDVEGNLFMYPGGVDQPITVGGLTNSPRARSVPPYNLGSVSLGTVKIGETVRIWVRWDKPNKRIVYGLQHLFPLRPPIEMAVPYSIPDTLEPLYRYRVVMLQTSPSNCISSRVYSDMVVKIDQVAVLR
ncbi:MAG: hypothetical protein U0V70_05270 [Terriglobia bacterium]